MAENPTYTHPIFNAGNPSLEGKISDRRICWGGSVGDPITRYESLGNYVIDMKLERLTVIRGDPTYTKRVRRKNRKERGVGRWNEIFSLARLRSFGKASRAMHTAPADTSFPPLSTFPACNLSII